MKSWAKAVRRRYARKNARKKTVARPMKRRRAASSRNSGEPSMPA
jgi:hypothetical protein